MSAQLRPAVLVMALAPLAVSALGLSFTRGPVDFREARRAEELQQLERATLSREESRRQVAQEVLAGQCSLSEAIAWFRDLEREWPDYGTPLGREWHTDEERHYRHIVVIVRYLLRGQPEEEAAAVRQLEEDYQQVRAGR
jgi:hypothetical protein